VSDELSEMGACVGLLHKLSIICWVNMSVCELLCAINHTAKTESCAHITGV
jgi:hypothetical protein